MEYSLGTRNTSERLLSDLYIDLRRRVNNWAAITKQTSQARMGYVGQHLVSVVTGYEGSRSGARGYDLVIGDEEYGEIKTCYRVDQLGKCNTCQSAVASTELRCPVCQSPDLERKDDSKWLITIKHTNEYSKIIDPRYYFLVLFDFLDLNNPDTIRASIWRVDPKSPGFAYCMIDYYENIRSKSQSKAPFNLWPFQLKFELMKPELIYRSYITSDDEITTEIFPGDTPSIRDAIDLVSLSKSKNLDLTKIATFTEKLGYIGFTPRGKKKNTLSLVQSMIDRDEMDQDIVCDKLAESLYWADIVDRIEFLPTHLKETLGNANLI